MGIVSLERFNRIIKITFNPDGTPEIVRCPAKGRKPSIEINGTFTTKNYLPSFNVTVKNLYLDLQGKQYTKIRIDAGYEGNTVPLEGSILTMYQEEPGPEGKTVIQCLYGNATDWLDSTIQLNYEAGTNLGVIIDALKTKVKANNISIGIKAGALVLKDPLMFDGTVRGAIEKIQKVFEEDHLSLFMQNSTLCAICLASGDFVGVKLLQYMSAPPQENTGDESGTYYTTVTAPWMPDLKIGDLLEIPSRVYIRNFGTVGGASKTQKVQVTAISFHFGTTGTTNQMTVQGFLVR